MAIIERVIIAAKDEVEENDTFDDYAYADYAINCFYDATLKEVVYIEDNIHGHPEAFLEGYMKCLTLNGCDPTIRKGTLAVAPDENLYGPETFLNHYNEIVWED